MAEEENTEEEKAGGSNKMIIIIIAALLVVLIGTGIALFFLLGDDEAEKVAENTEEPVVEEVVKTPIYVPLHPAFLANFEDQSSATYLQVDIQVMTYSTDVEDAIKTHMPKIRNDLLLLFSSQKFEELNTVKGKRKLSKDALKAVHDVLVAANAPSEVEDLLFTSFVMQ